MPKKQRADARLNDIQERFLERAQELWDLHEGEFMQVLEDAESRKVNLTFTATLDFSESTAKLETQIRFSQVVKDKKQDDFDDPNQTKLPGIDPKDAEDKPAKRGRKPKKTSDKDEFPSGKDAASGAGKDA